MTHLLMFNLAVDADDPVLGFTTRWLNELARHYTTVDVITMRVGRLAVADNVRVYSVGKERGISEAGRVPRFYAILARLLRRKRYERCFAHMMPLFAVMGAPLLALYRLPLLLWYTHRQDHRVLRLAERAAWRVITASPDSFPFATPKLTVMGHGIDTDFYAPADQLPTQPPTILHVARLSPIKHQDTLLHATHDLPARVLLVGDAVHADDHAYAERLQALATLPERAVSAQLAGSLSAEQVISWMHRSSIGINLSPVGLFDKAALECMACGLPTIVANPAFDEVLGDHTARLRVAAPDDIDGLRDRLQALLALSAPERQQIGTDLRQAVVQQHGLPHLIERIVALK